MEDCDKTINVSYPNEEPCEQVSANCVLTEEAISYLGVEQGDPITEVMAKMVQSLMDSRARLKNAEDRLAIEESLTKEISFITPSLVTVAGSTEQSLVDIVLGDKTLTSELRGSGKAYEVEIEGKITNSATTDSHVIDVKIGTLVLLSFRASSGFPHTNETFKINSTLLFKTNGLFAYGTMRFNDTSYYDSTDITIDNDISENLDVTFKGLQVSDEVVASVKLKSI